MATTTLKHEPQGRHQSKKATASGWIGSALEYYDFFIYATAAALIFPQIFFPKGDPQIAIIASLATYGVGYVARPIGAVDPEDYYDYQVNRPLLWVDEQGMRQLRWPGMQIFLARPPGSHRDIVLVRGIEPSMRWRQFVSELLAALDDLGVRLVVTVGAMLAEVRGGVTTRGWIYQPMTGRSYVAERGGGVRLNGEAIVRTSIDRPPLGASSKRKLHGYTADGRLSPVVGSKFACAFDYPDVLHGEIDFMFYNRLHPWDHLAGSLMVTENGGISRTLDGLAYTLLSKSRGLLVAGDTLSWMAAQQYWPVGA